MDTGFIAIPSWNHLGKYSKSYNLLKLVMQIEKKDSRLSTFTFVLVWFLIAYPLFVSLLLLFFAPFRIAKDSSYIKEVFKVVKDHI